MPKLDVTKTELNRAETMLNKAIRELDKCLNTMAGGSEYRSAEYEFFEFTKDDLEHVLSLIERVKKSM